MGLSVLWFLCQSAAFLLAARLARESSKKRITPRSGGKEARMIAAQAAMAMLQAASLIGAEMSQRLLVFPSTDEQLFTQHASERCALRKGPMPLLV